MRLVPCGDGERAACGALSQCQLLYEPAASQACTSAALAVGGASAVPGAVPGEPLGCEQPVTATTVTATTSVRMARVRRLLALGYARSDHTIKSCACAGRGWCRRASRP